MEGNSQVMKYFDALDEFVTVNPIPRDFLNSLELGNEGRRGYKSLIVSRLIQNYKDLWDKNVDMGEEMDRDVFDELLYQLCVDVHPPIEIHQVNIPLKRGSLESVCASPNSSGPHLSPSSNRKITSAKFMFDFKKRIIGQDQIFEPIRRAVQRYTLDIRDPQRPAGVFLLAGPTGVGKTETAKVFQQTLFGDDDMVRVDCSEFSQRHEVAKIMGAPPGYLGHGGEDTPFVKSLRQKPRSVVLFDEIEKAHPQFYNLMFQILDEGRLTPGKGAPLFFGDSVIFFTSNVGADRLAEVQNGMSFSRGAPISGEVVDETYRTSLQRHFDSALLGRIPDILVYNPLSFETAVKVAGLEFGKEALNFKRGGYSISCSEGTLEEITRRANFKVYGGREIRKRISSDIGNPVLDRIESGDVKEGDEVRVTFKRNNFLFSVKKSA